jgi:hypothetical protein
MKFVRQLTLAAGVAAMTIAATGAATAKNMSHAHMGHVAKGWTDTPAKTGLLPTAVEEAKIALYHANALVQKTDNLKWMQTHAHHVLHAVDASTEAKGPGKGYGVLKAAAGTAKHIQIAAKQKDASKNVKTHAVHVAASALNTVERAKRMVTVAKKIVAAKSAAEAAPLARKLAEIAVELQAGRDANGDGKITWVKGEGGLKASAKHLGIMYKLEGMK